MKELEKDMTLLRSGMKECGREARGQMMMMMIMVMMMMMTTMMIIMTGTRSRFDTSRSSVALFVVEISRLT